MNIIHGTYFEVNNLQKNKQIKVKGKGKKGAAKTFDKKGGVYKGVDVAKAA